MARIRTIKPEFPQSESMGSISRDSRLTFLLLFTLADDHGRLRGNSRMLASLLFPYDSDVPELMDGWMSELEREGCITRYKIEGSTYIQINNWAEHQRVDKPSASKIPPYSQESSRGFANPREDNENYNKSSRDAKNPVDIEVNDFREDSRILARIPSRRGEEGKGKEGKGEERARAENFLEEVSEPKPKVNEIPSAPYEQAVAEAQVELGLLGFRNVPDALVAGQWREMADHQSHRGQKTHDVRGRWRSWIRRWPEVKPQALEPYRGDRGRTGSAGLADIC